MPTYRQSNKGIPRFPLKGSFKGDVDIGIDIDVGNIDAGLDAWGT